jgi:hypothetical protein
MFDSIERTEEFALIETIAVALRTELGADKEDQPGYRDPSEAGQINRAFRAAASVILRKIALPQECLPTLVSRILMQLARRRLSQSGLDERDAEFLLEVERGRDDWLAFLILTTDAEIAHVLSSERPERP